MKRRRRRRRRKGQRRMDVKGNERKNMGVEV